MYCLAPLHPPQDRNAGPPPVILSPLKQQTGGLTKKKKKRQQALTNDNQSDSMPLHSHSNSDMSSPQGSQQPVAHVQPLRSPFPHPVNRSDADYRQKNDHRDGRSSRDMQDSYEKYEDPHRQNYDGYGKPPKSR